MTASASAVRFSVVAQNLSSKSLFNVHSFAPKRRPIAVSKRKLTCKALQKTELSIKEEGKPETLDYRVFFHDSTGRKAAINSMSDTILSRVEVQHKLELWIDPQTWEDPSFSNTEVDGAFGDNDPGHTAIRVWFRDYMIPDGKTANKFGLGNKVADKMAPHAKAASMEVAQVEATKPKTSKKKKEKSSECAGSSEASSRDGEYPYQILKYPVTTEHALKELETNKTLVFVVDKRARKKNIRSAVEKLYNIQMKKVNTLMRPDGTKNAYVICKSDVSNKFGYV